MLASRICLLLSFCAVGSTKAQAATYSLYKNDYYCINTECLWYGSDGKTVEECASAVVVDGNCSGTFYGKEGHCFCVRQGATCVEAQSSSGNSIYRTPKEAISTALSTTTGATALPPATEAISTALSTTTGATALPPTTEAYCGYEKCAWTFDWSCPGQDLGRNGTARDDGTDGYKCCCKDELWRQAEEASCSDETCAWTLDWSCPGQDLGRIGAAKDDGTMGYKCCCKEGLWPTAVQAKIHEAGTVTTTTVESVDAGNQTIRLADVSGLSPSMSLTISSGGNSETKTIMAMTVARRLSSSSRRLAAGSVTVDSPLLHSYPADATIMATSQATTTAAPTSGGTADSQPKCTNTTRYYNVEGEGWEHRPKPRKGLTLEECQSMCQHDNCTAWQWWPVRGGCRWFTGKVYSEEKEGHPSVGGTTNCDASNLTYNGTPISHFPDLPSDDLDKANCSDACGWTLYWSCPGQDLGVIGTAHDDGTLRYKCCCKDGLWRSSAQAALRQLFVEGSLTDVHLDTEDPEKTEADAQYWCNLYSRNCAGYVYIKSYNEYFLAIPDGAWGKVSGKGSYSTGDDFGRVKGNIGTVMVKKESAEALSTTTMEQLATPTQSSIAKSDGNRRLFSNGFILV